MDAHLPGATRPLLDRLTLAISDPGAFTPRHREQRDGETIHETISRWGARAVLAVLADAGSPLAPERAAEIEALTAAATPGPWSVDTVGGLFVEAAEGAVADLAWAAQDETELAAMKADAEFIAAARADVPLLLAAYREVDAHRCVQDDRIHQLENELEQARTRRDTERGRLLGELERRVAAVREVAFDLDEELRDVLGWDAAHAIRDRINAAVDGPKDGA